MRFSFSGKFKCGRWLLMWFWFLRKIHLYTKFLRFCSNSLTTLRTRMLASPFQHFVYHRHCGQPCHLHCHHHLWQPSRISQFRRRPTNSTADQLFHCFLGRDRRSHWNRIDALLYRLCIGGLLATGIRADTLRFVAFGWLHCLSRIPIYCITDHSWPILLCENCGEIQSLED